MGSEKVKRKGSGAGNNEGDRSKKKKKKISSSSASNESVNNKEGGPEEQLRFFLDQFEAAKGVQLSSLELESLKDSCIVEVSQDADSDLKKLGNNIKLAFGESWKESLCEGGKVGEEEEEEEEEEVPGGSPAVVVISSSALRSIHLLRGFHSLTKQCPPVKLFSKHIKIEEQISLLKNRVNIASGTPSRIKKLIEIEALGLSRLRVVVLDVHPDVKGYSLFTLPQVRDEFWDLFNNYFYQPIIQGHLRICLYAPYKLPLPLKPRQTTSSS